MRSTEPRNRPTRRASGVSPPTVAHSIVERRRAQTRDATAQPGQQVGHDAHIRNLGDVRERAALLGEQACGDERKRGVLVAAHMDPARQAPAAFDEQGGHDGLQDSAGLKPALLRVVVGRSPASAGGRGFSRACTVASYDTSSNSPRYTISSRRPDAEAFRDVVLAPLYEGADVRRARAAIVDDEVPVNAGDAGVPDARAFESRAVDQRTRRCRDVRAEPSLARGPDSERCSRRSARRAAACVCERRATRARRRAARRGDPRPPRTPPTAQAPRSLEAARVVAELHVGDRDSAYVPSRETRRTSTMSSPIIRPWKWALPWMAPPTVPGVPAQASSPDRPCPTVHLTKPLIVSPAPARIRSPHPCGRRSCPERARRAPARRGRRRAHSTRRRALSPECARRMRSGRCGRTGPRSALRRADPQDHRRGTS